MWVPYLSLIAGFFFFLPKLTEPSEKKNPEQTEVKEIRRRRRRRKEKEKKKKRTEHPRRKEKKSLQWSKVAAGTVVGPFLCV